MIRQLFLAFLFTLPLLNAGGQPGPKDIRDPELSMEKKITVEIWSDVVCPFCYIGKRNFETALVQFTQRDRVEVVWKSFQLQPDMKTDPSISVYEAFSKIKGMDREEAEELHQDVAERAMKAGLDYRFDNAVPANTFNAHCFLHFAKDKGKQGEAKELLLQSYFTEGKNIDDLNTLAALGLAAGMDDQEVLAALRGQTYADAVRKDIQEARQVGVRGVPFFLINDQYVVNGAQAPSVFLQTLEKAGNDIAAD